MAIVNLTDISKPAFFAANQEYCYTNRFGMIQTILVVKRTLHMLTFVDSNGVKHKAHIQKTPDKMSEIIHLSHSSITVDAFDEV